MARFGVALQVKLGHLRDDSGLGHCDADGGGETTVTPPKESKPLTRDVVGYHKGLDVDADHTRREDIVHITLSGMNVSGTVINR